MLRWQWGSRIVAPLHWRHHERDGVSNHQPHDCLFNRLFKRRSKKISKFCVTGLCAGNSPGPVNSPHKRARNAENASIWWRHHGLVRLLPNSQAQPVRVISVLFRWIAWDFSSHIYTLYTAAWCQVKWNSVIKRCLLGGWMSRLALGFQCQYTRASEIA